MPCLSVSIVGAGRVGQTLGRWLVQHHLATVLNVLCLDREHAQAACDFIGAGKPVTDIEYLQPADITWITTPDAAIVPTLLQCIAKNVLKHGSVVVHCSGAYASSLLASAKHTRADLSLASVHPLKSFAHPALSGENFAGTYCTLEGEEAALVVLRPLLIRLGARLLSIRPEDKPRYHSACVLASNYTVTLFHAAWECFKTAGMEASCAKALTDSLMQGALMNVRALQEPVAALTGPLVRGETEVVAMHLASLEESPALRALYLALEQATTAMLHRSVAQDLP